MKKFIHYFMLILLLSACSKKSYLERSNEDKALQDAVKKLARSQDNEDAIGAIPILYSNIQKAHLAKIASYRTGKDIGRWDKIISEYDYLQDAYNAIINSTPAFRLVNPQNYSAELLEAKQQGAEENYIAGQTFIDKDGRDNAKKAYSYFSKANKLVPGYKDAKAQMNNAYELSIVNVIINPIQDNSYFINSGWGSSGYNYSNEYFQQTLVRELQNSNGNGRYAARFYTDWEARRENVQPDWAVDLRLRDLNIPYPVSNTYSRSRSAEVRNGTDTSGKPIYKTVYATLNVQRSSFTANANMEMTITDVRTRKNISYKNYREDYRWQEERASYTGDSRALSSDDWALINNNNYNTPRREDILSELYRKIYPQVKSNISYTVDW
ncbi:hypothetical protein [Ferruginibacter sp. HRS2-29]|uniref:hypothetical protein n=2 Tax=Ferruginibacter sp. HRS2-29 TaxID=2487334 RepID=UPI0020CDFC07|nr:hypothetical protein [Ferruginibacter sp. HRS2-29]MCP9752869.1 hypothetical protein [Ferruginibacter sp. HRS2-29]